VLQHLLDMPPSAEKFTKLARLAHDFVFAAETYGKIIISELGLPGKLPTITPPFSPHLQRENQC
jgi:hypothetical protein